MCCVSAVDGTPQLKEQDQPKSMHNARHHSNTAQEQPIWLLLLSTMHIAQSTNMCFAASVSD
jgi:hypothetical protein